MGKRHLTVHEAADAVGVSAATLRRYEKTGILEPASRDRNGWRRYSEDHIRKIAAVVDPDVSRE